MQIESHKVNYHNIYVWAISLTYICMYMYVCMYVVYINKPHKVFRFPNSRSHALRKVSPCNRVVRTASGTGVGLDDLIAIVFAPRRCLVKSNVVNILLLFYCDYFYFLALHFIPWGKMLQFFFRNFCSFRCKRVCCFCCCQFLLWKYLFKFHSSSAHLKLYIFAYILFDPLNFPRKWGCYFLINIFEMFPGMIKGHIKVIQLSILNETSKYIKSEMEMKSKMVCQKINNNTHTLRVRPESKRLENSSPNSL